MSFACAKHGWAHSFDCCPRCSEFPVSSGTTTGLYLKNKEQELLSEIDQLRAERDRYKSALKAIESGQVYFDGLPGKTPKTRAREALK